MQMDSTQEANDQQDQQSTLPKKTVSVSPASNNDWEKEKSSREAASNVIRAQIDNIIDTNQTESTKPEESNPYFRDHKKHVDPELEKWQEYHSAWQNYYQKYYEGYYSQYLKNIQKQLEENHQNQSPPPKQPLTKEEELFDLRQRLLKKIKKTTTTVKTSQHFWPLIAGLVTVLVFLFLQFNQIILSNVLAYVSPGNIDAQNIVIDPNESITVAADPRLIIPKINIDVPVAYDVGNDYDSQMKTMENGLAHFSIPGANAHPGEIGNTVIAGHSSSNLFDNGKYKFIFVQLDKLIEGDVIYANYNSKRYTYVVTKKEVVEPTAVDKLIYETTLPVMTLITCTPIGTATSRLLVTAEQINPDPSKAIATTNDANGNEVGSIPGDPPTLWERLFGLNSD